MVWKKLDGRFPFVHRELSRNFSAKLSTQPEGRIDEPSRGLIYDAIRFGSHPMSRSTGESQPSFRPLPISLN